MDRATELLFDKRVHDGLANAALFYKLRGDEQRARHYLSILEEIKTMKTEYEKGKHHEKLSESP